MFIKTIMFGRDKRFCMIKLHGKTPKLFEIRPLVMENEALKVPLCGGGITLKSSILAYPHPLIGGAVQMDFSICCNVHRIEINCDRRNYNYNIISYSAGESKETRYRLMYMEFILCS